MKHLVTLFTIVFLCPLIIIAQPENSVLGEVQVPSPDVAALGKFVDVPVGHFTGVPNVTIPIHTVQQGELSLPISLSYHNSGVRVSETAGWVGLGWALNAGGVVSRAVIGLPDEATNGYITLGDTAALNQVGSGTGDGEPDLFTFSFNGYSGRFIFDRDIDSIRQFPHSDLRIKATLDASQIATFVITTTDGTLYYFGSELAGYHGNTIVESVVTERTPNSTQRTEWYLKKIVSYDRQDSIQFYYHEAKFGVMSTPTETRSRVYGVYTLHTEALWNKDFVQEGSNGSGIFESHGHYNLGPLDMRTSYDVYGTWHGYESRYLDSITTASEKIVFHKGDARKDLSLHPRGVDSLNHVYTHVDNNSYELGEITVEPKSIGSYCKSFEFDYDYFKNDATPTYTFDVRLMLQSITEKSCIVGDDAEVEPYYFEYVKRDTSENFVFLPWRLTNAQDKWGFYNGEDDNDDYEFNIPYQTASVSVDGYVVRDTFDGSANRNSYEQPMLYGSLRRVTYPEGGSTKFLMEANTVYQEAFNYVIDTLRNGPFLVTFSSCSNVIDMNSMNTCCSGLGVSDTTAFTFADSVLERGTFVLKCTQSSGDNCALDTIDSQESWYGTVYLSILDTNGTLVEAPIGYGTRKNGDTMRYSIAGLDDLEANTPYLLKVTSWMSLGEVYIEMNTPVDISDNVYIGGLRAQSIEYYDQQTQPLGTTLVDDTTYLLRRIKYDYADTANSNKSSGILFVEPSFAYVATTWEANSVPLPAGATEVNGYTKLEFRSSPVIALSDRQGNHIGYEHVKQFEDNGAATLYSFKARTGQLINNGYPIAPANYRYDNGEKEFGEIVADQTTIGQTDSRGNVRIQDFDDVVCLRAEEIVGDGGMSGSIYMYNAFSYTNSGYYLMDSVITVLDDVETTTIYSYGDDHLQPTSIVKSNTDGESIQSLTKFAHEKSNTDLISRNMIGIPLEQTVVRNGVTVDGSRTDYTLFGGTPYPEKFYNYKITWDANGTLVNNEGNNWELAATVLDYTSDGMPEFLEQAGWGVDSFYWDSNTKLLTERRYNGFRWQYEYHPSSRLLKKMTDIDGQETEYFYDGLQRLDSTSARGGNVKASYEYNYDDQPYVRSRIEYTSKVGSDFTFDETYQYFDGIGRPIQDVHVQHASGTEQDVVIARKYDRYGRLSVEYQPFESANSDGSFVESIPSGVDSTVTEYEESPLNRVAKMTSPELNDDVAVTNYTYGGNGASLYGHAINTLNFTKITDPNGNHAYEYTDMFGRSVLKRRANSNESLTNDTYFTYDNKDRLRQILPPGVNASDADLRFDFLYDPDDNVIFKKVPDKGGIDYLYDDRDLMTYMKEDISDWVHYKYDVYGRDTASGFVSRTPTDGDNLSAFSTQLTSKQYDGSSLIEKGKISSEWIASLQNPSEKLTTAYDYDIYGRVSMTESNHIGAFGDADALKIESTYDFSDLPLVVQQTVVSGSDTHVTVDSMIYDQSGRQIEQYVSIDGEQSQICEMSYDQKDQLTEKNIGKSGSHWLQSVDYTYLNNGFLSRINSSSGSGNSALETCAPYLTAKSSTAGSPDNNDLFFLELFYDEIQGVSGLTTQSNGNISAMAWRVHGRERQAYHFEYDYLDRLTDGNFYRVPDGSVPAANTAYNTTYGYDVRGNIESITRRSLVPSGAGDCWDSKLIDDLAFDYFGGTNRLRDVDDEANSADRHLGYPYYDTTNVDYSYDANGNITYDPSRGLTIAYNHLNLPDTMSFDSGDTIFYTYDASGIKWAQETRSSGGALSLRHYIGQMEFEGIPGSVSLKAVNHAEGHIVRRNTGIHVLSGTVSGTESTCADNIISTQDILASAEVDYLARGKITLKPGFSVTSGASFRALPNAVCGGNAWQWQYYLKDHLGNVRVVFADDNGDGKIANNTEILEENHYYPFGMRMDGPWVSSHSGNRYKYNGKERIEEFGAGNMYDYGARFYDPSIGRFTGVDPISDQFPWVSTYNYAENEPIAHIDLWGLQALDYSAAFNPPTQRGSEKVTKTLVEPAAEIAIGFTPAGVVVDVADFTNAVSEGDRVGAVLSGIGFIPGVGDALKGVGKFVRSLFKGSDEMAIIATSFGEKINNQLDARGWTQDSVEELISNPSDTRSVRDTRWNADGTKRDDPATAYLDSNGNYVIRNDNTGDVVQVSDQNDPNWKSPWDED